MSVGASVTSRLARAEAWLAAHHRAVLLAVVVGSALLRIAFWLELRDTPIVRAHQWTQTDMHFFDAWAKAIASGDWRSNAEHHPLMEWQAECARQWFEMSPASRARYPGADLDAARALWNHWLGGKTFHQEPLYVYLIAATYRLFGPEVRFVFYWQMALGVASNALLWQLTRRYFGELTAAVAAAIALLYAPLMFYEVALVRTTLTAFIGLALALVTDHALTRATPRGWFTAGLSFGVAMLCQTTFATYALGGAALLALTHRTDPRTLAKLGGAMALGVALGMSPLVARNVSVGVRPLAWASVGPFTFLADNEASYDPDIGAQGLSPAQVRIMGETDGRMGEIVRASLASHPTGGWARMLARKFAKMWHWYEEPDNQNFYYAKRHSELLARMPFTFFALSPLALLGLALAARDVKRSSPLYLMIVAGIAVGVLAMPFSRYRVPYEAAMIPFAALCLTRLATWIESRRWGYVVALVAAAIALFAWTSRPLPRGRTQIRVADYISPYGYFWGPRLEAARSPAEAAAVFEASLEVEPPELRALAARPRRLSRFQVELARSYLPIYAGYARALADAGRAEDAARARAMATFLAEVVRVLGGRR